MSKKNQKRERKSIITILIVIILIIILAAITNGIVKNNSEKTEDIENKTYYTHLDEEDMMQYEYKKINAELNGIFAFAISENNLVAVKGKDEIINIMQIDAQKEYDYLYYKTKLYLLDKATGSISIIPLNINGNAYNVESTINLNTNVQSFEIYNGDIFYISNNKLLKYSNGNVEEWGENITSNNLVVKLDNIYVSKNNNLVKIDMEKNETTIAEYVNDIYYYNYYERNKLIYDTRIDGENNFKNVYNFYSGEITNSIKNNTYFIPYKSSNYIYLTNNKKQVMMINKSGSGEYIFKSNEAIENISFLKEGYLLVQTGSKNILLDVDIENEELIEIENKITNIKYLK